ncbi:MAG: RelA/SpoT family protein [Oscillospiraceae bacterium]|nr:RelA/SpoT family protein [Oscillospiraceae bacterium]
MNTLSEHDTMERFMEKVRRAGGEHGKYDLDKIRDAFELACDLHEGQTRKSGEPYIMHPIAVAEILLEYLMDTDTIVAALLHDAVEDTAVTLDELREQFGSDVARLVDGVTKVGKVKLIIPGTQMGSSEEMTQHLTLTEEEQKSENIRKILVSMGKDPRVMIIKLADRVHNLRTLGVFRESKQTRISLETIEFHAPIAHRMGIALFKDELENTALQYFDKYAYEDILTDLEAYKQKREESINKITERVRSRLSGMECVLEIEGRIKGIYSLYKKYYLTGKSIDEIYDVYAIRVITERQTDCYNVLGIIHDAFTPLSGRFKDFIANPKSNGYQSLHTTVVGREKQPFEVQIRTREMHNIAIFGVAAHWKYKTGNEHLFADDSNAAKDRFAVIRKALDYQEFDSQALLAETIKTDLSPDEVHVFTPTGEPKSLPSGSTVVDFAYALSPEIGNAMTGATVHAKKVSMTYELQNGDVIDIKTAEDASGPSRSWLEYVKTSAAKAIIQTWLKNARPEENIASGRALVEGILRREGLSPSRKVKDGMAELLKERRFDTAEDFYAAIGYGGVSVGDVSIWLKEKFESPKRVGSAELRVVETPPMTYSDIRLTVETSNKEELDEVISRLNKIHCIVDMKVREKTRENMRDSQ